MNNGTNRLESLFERTQEYSRISLEIWKLKALDQASSMLSSILSRAMVLFVLAMFLLIGSLGFALWLGEILGKIWIGFIVVTAFYGILGVVVYFLMHQWIKKTLCNYIIRRLLN